MKVSVGQQSKERGYGAVGVIRPNASTASRVVQTDGREDGANGPGSFLYGDRLGTPSEHQVARILACVQLVRIFGR